MILVPFTSLSLCSLSRANLQAGLPEGSAGRADKLWKEVVGVTLNDPLVGEAVARDFMPAEPGDHSNAKLTDREMEVSTSMPCIIKLYFTLSPTTSAQLI